MRIREANPEDAENLINLIKQVESKSDYMLMEAGERKTTSAQQMQYLERIEKHNNSTIFVAEAEKEFGGYLIAIGGTAKRTKHTAYLVIGILPEYRGQGIGTALFQHMGTWAINHNISRLELTVVTQNKAGLALYKKSGFKIEGTKHRSMIINGECFDEYMMAKLMD